MTQKEMDISGLRALKASIARSETALKHLDSVIGGHIKSLDKTLSKILGGKPVRIVSPNKSLLEKMASPANLLTRGIESFARQSLNIVFNGGADANPSGSNMSHGQVLAEAASAISRAMRRNL